LCSKFVSVTGGGEIACVVLIRDAREIMAENASCIRVGTMALILPPGGYLQALTLATSIIVTMPTTVLVHGVSIQFVV